MLYNVKCGYMNENININKTIAIYIYICIRSVVIMMSRYCMYQNSTSSAAQGGGGRFKIGNL